MGVFCSLLQNPPKIGSASLGCASLVFFGEILCSSLLGHSSHYLPIIPTGTPFHDLNLKHTCLEVVYTLIAEYININVDIKAEK